MLAMLALSGAFLYEHHHHVSLGCGWPEKQHIVNEQLVDEFSGVATRHSALVFCDGRHNLAA